MNLFAPLIRRPVGTSLLAIGLALAGFCAYLLLGVAAFPSLDFPGLAVAASMPGASAQTMSTSVMAPLERHLGRIPGVRSIYGTASDGGMQIQVMFEFGRSTDVLARDVQAAINAAQPDLPNSLPSPPQYFKFSTSQFPILLVTLTSTSMPPDRLYDLADTLLKPAMAQVPGVAQVQVFGSTPHAVRIELNNGALAAKGLTANDVANVLRAANVTSPQGTLSDGLTQITVTANDALHTTADFASLLVAMRNGVPVKLSDVATVSSGQEDKYAAAWFNGQRTVGMQIAKKPEANAVATVDALRAALPRLRGLLPADVQITPIFDLTQTTRSALHEVETTLVISIFMVAVVMLLFLRRMRPTVIAMLSVPLSLAGAFVAMWLLGFTLNILSLVALVLCVGFVVDDAIVVIENIVRHIEQGKTPLQSALEGVREIGFTVISITLSLVAVFAPMVFGNNMFTMLMREFSVTLVATIVISALVSLTLTPALCGRFLAQEPPEQAAAPGRLARAVERMDQGMLRAYQRALDWAMRHRRLMRWQPAILLLLTVVLAVAVFKSAGGGVMPSEDSGMLITQISADANVSPAELARRTHAVMDIMQSDPAILDVTTLLGGNNNNGAVGSQSTMFVDLKPYGDGPGRRHESMDKVIERLSARCKALPGLNVSVNGLHLFGGGSGGGGGQGSAYNFQLNSVSGAPLQPAVAKLAAVMRKMKEFRDVTTSFDAIGKQQMLEVDRDAASRLGVSVGDVDTALSNAFSQSYASTIYSDISQYRVILTSDTADQLSPAALLNTYVRSSNGKMVPLSALAKIGTQPAPTSVDHYNQLESASVGYNLASGVSQVEGLQRIDDAMAAAALPAGIQKQYTGDNQNLMEALTGSLLMLLAVIAAMYVVLGILYESLIHPLTILSTLPAAATGAFLALLVTHSQLTLMAVIAVLMLIGIVKKNAILMVDFALVAEREHGLPPPEAIREAALVRFRPITMTTLVAIGAALPLAIGFGAGSEMRQPLGIAIVGGLLVSQMLTLLSTPAIYLWGYDRKLRKAARRARRQARKTVQLAGGT